MLRYTIRNFVCISVLLVMSHSIPVRAQQEASTTVKGQPQTTKAAAVPMQIGPGDLLEIAVYDSPELAQQVRVDSDGKVQLALLGETKVAGLTAQEAAALIADQLRARNFLLHPNVNVLIKEFASQGVSVTGEVQHPGVYQVLTPRTVLDVISMAGGLTNVADNRVTIKRRFGAEETVTTKLNDIDAEISLAHNVQVYPGDLVLVPRAGIVYVLGDVSRPGGFVMQNNGNITLLQALAQAGGATSTAAVNHTVWLRKSGDGYVTTKVQLGKIERGEQPDVELHANDIVFLPNDRLKNAMRSTKDLASSVGGASIYAIMH